ncbi:hypothetical protein EYF80_027688 [Liparis tanakae]|uniref:Uncharacterized protein n=1 Tax=Liparis tanakae TaxID=230148 RepID=A0A4Z2H8J3_9TELE|nr:hypothetical protein EYF80_027688 [Liparis tanakae]
MSMRAVFEPEKAFSDRCLHESTFAMTNHSSSVRRTSRGFLVIHIKTSVNELHSDWARPLLPLNPAVDSSSYSSPLGLSRGPYCVRESSAKGRTGRSEPD